ncbi:MAG: outer membrane protein assembly factor BamE [SAR86 cluster bacterium]|uniref:Outer membrane protein assembly factor BamE n=1 Tax=SAR86 cluster bacterium TaxID=2030880 RepID=A0A972VZ62_9GAMM|nr:outer membrane protein assembly factor BamE [SAR86 cluster bacterium]
MIRHRLSTAISILVLCSFASGCSSLRFPGVHRISIQQGNVITQTMIDKLKPGMSKSQVRFVLGNAVINDSLNQNRWDYIYSIQVAGGDRIINELHLHFIEERLSHFEGDFSPTPEAT